jgi:hypothetical protein
LQLLTESTIVCMLGVAWGLTALAVSLRWFEWARGLRALNEMLPWLSAATTGSFLINVMCAVWPLLREAARPPREALASN